VYAAFPDSLDGSRIHNFRLLSLLNYVNKRSNFHDKGKITFHLLQNCMIFLQFIRRSKHQQQKKEGSIHISKKANDMRSSSLAINLVLKIQQNALRQCQLKTFSGSSSDIKTQLSDYPFFCYY